MRPLTATESELLGEARTAVLATIDPTGRPRLVPVCFVALGGELGADRPNLYTPIDQKPKGIADPRRLARVRDILARPEVTVLVERWDEDWSRLAWVRLHGLAELLEPVELRVQADGTSADGIPAGTDRRATAEVDERAVAIAALRARYPQYADHHLESRPLIRIAITRASSWAATGPDRGRAVSDGASGPRGDG